MKHLNQLIDRSILIAISSTPEVARPYVDLNCSFNANLTLNLSSKSPIVTILTTTFGLVTPDQGN